MKITAAVLTKNAEKTIGICLRSVSFVDEVLIIDDHSNDRTLDLVESTLKGNTSCRVLKRDLDGNFASQRNFALQHADSEWVLFVDSDEEVSRELQTEISQILTQGSEKFGAYSLRRRDFFWGKELKYGETMKARNEGIVRLVRKGSGSWEGNVHEEFRMKNTELRIKNLTNFLNHYPHQTVQEFLREVNYYSSLRANELHKQGKKANVLKILLFPFGKFIFTYVIRLGFLDGPAGFAYAFFMSFHSFLVRAKLYQYRVKHEA